jgi:preprotein translocase subunit YajC
VRVKWETWAGNKYEGEVIEVDSNVLHIKLDNGTEIAVESDGVIVVSD